MIYLQIGLCVDKKRSFLNDFLFLFHFLKTNSKTEVFCPLQMFFFSNFFLFLFLFLKNIMILFFKVKKVAKFHKKKTNAGICLKRFVVSESKTQRLFLNHLKLNFTKKKRKLDILLICGEIGILCCTCIRSKKKKLFKNVPTPKVSRISKIAQFVLKFPLHFSSTLPFPQRRLSFVKKLVSYRFVYYNQQQKYQPFLNFKNPNLFIKFLRRFSGINSATDQ